jgi:hypothetical protein
MSTHARATFDIDSWDEESYDEQEGAKLARTHVTKTFHGDLEGTSTAELLMAYAQDGSAAYVGFERIEGNLHGRRGTFVIHHTATMSTSGQSAAWSVVPDSSTGELRGLRGDVQIVNEPGGGHTFTLEYDLD